MTRGKRATTENQAPWWLPLVTQIAIPLITAALPVIREYIQALLKNFQDENVTAREIAVAENIVNGIEKANPDWSGEKKLAYAKGAFDHWCENYAPQISQANRNILIELAVQKLKSESRKG